MKTLYTTRLYQRVLMKTFFEPKIGWLEHTLLIIQNLILHVLRTP